MPTPSEKWKAGDRITFWAGRQHGWVVAPIVSVSLRGVPTVIDPTTGKRRVLRR